MQLLHKRYPLVNLHLHINSKLYDLLISLPRIFWAYFPAIANPTAFVHLVLKWSCCNFNSMSMSIFRMPWSFWIDCLKFLSHLLIHQTPINEAKSKQVLLHDHPENTNLSLFIHFSSADLYLNVYLKPLQYQPFP